MTGCCIPSTPRSGATAPTRIKAGCRRPACDGVPIPGGRALIGTGSAALPEDGEGPLRTVRLRDFRLSASAVTNAEFADFIADTGYVTDAQRFGWSFVFWKQVPEGHGPTEAVSGADWWRRVDGAVWSSPNGPGTHGACLPDHPVVHVSWQDARAYCVWAGGRLPTEAEWEHAARGGLGDVRFPWGNAEPDDAGFTPCNIWQGRFPDVNTARDGYATTAPARSFEPNGYGLFNMVGNVWEWTSDPFRVRSLKRDLRVRDQAARGHKLSKGGSFLCHRSYCYRYRIAARSGSAPDSTTTHQGFRVAWNARTGD